ncbi:glycosyltransferase family 4 protein [Georgenia faecalis]|uniref:glycosyltransferase family 4 protein n=1 Tax=Georgenia faecalis TaxID=2483799 RepID=UPI001F49483D|nr:glycosyltransferase family 4 protein [Georgenia faecalis]
MVSHVYPPRRGTRRSVKGHEDFIDAIGLVRQHAPEVVGLIVGGPTRGAEKYYETLQQRATRVATNNIVFAGPRSDIPDIYRASDVAVHPSLSENIGGAGESLLVATPTITTNVGGFPDVVRPGISGLMVRAKRPDELAAAILRSREEPTRGNAMARTGQQYIQEIGNASTNALRVLDVYDRMARRP